MIKSIATFVGKEVGAAALGKAVIALSKLVTTRDKLVIATIAGKLVIGTQMSTLVSSLHFGRGLTIKFAASFVGL